jgi:hypothetical protein
MSIFRSYINKNNSLISNSDVNTGRNPVMELNFGAQSTLTPFKIPFSGTQINSGGFTRFIFDLDLSELIENVNSGLITRSCLNNMIHRLKMVNSSYFEEDLLNTKMTNGRRRATSFDLILFRIPNYYGYDGDSQPWDEGVGYDFSDFNISKTSAIGGSSPLTYVDDRSFSTRPSNWYQRQTINNWSEPGLYNNKNEGTNVNYDDLVILDVKHFEFGNEDIDFDMTDEINDILDGNLTDVAGWGIAYVPDVENITGLTETYSVGFFTRHTQTFYQPFLETTYDDLIEDDRNNFVKNQENKLYLYIYQNGVLVNLDENPTVDIKNRNDEILVADLETCYRTTGIYEVIVPNIFSLQRTPCEFYDIWKGLTINGQPLEDITNDFILKDSSSKITIGTLSKTPEKFGFDFYGIKQDEKILNTDIRKVGVVIKKAYSTQTVLSNVEAFYRVYVKEGTTEVQVQDWTKINRTPNEYYFIFNTTDKIPDQYYIDIKVNISGEKDTYKKQLTFQIVNKK